MNYTTEAAAQLAAHIASKRQERTRHPFTREWWEGAFKREEPRRPRFNPKSPVSALAARLLATSNGFHDTKRGGERL